MGPVFYCLGVMALLGLSSPAFPQTAKMTDEQQEWFLCVISKEWCVAHSVDRTTGEQKAIAMVAALGPLQLRSGVSRATLQIGCSEGKPTTMLHTGREIPDAAIVLQYRVEPTGRSGQLTANNVSAGHFFRFPDDAFLHDLKGASKVTFEVKLPNEKPSNELQFNVGGASNTLGNLSCAPALD
jgi:hypothetical protein